MRRLVFVLLALAWAGGALAQAPAGMRQWSLTNRPSTPADQTTGYNTTTGYSETYYAATGTWAPTGLSGGLSTWAQTATYGAILATAGAPLTPGIGYVPGDTITVAGGTLYASSPAVLSVNETLAVSASIITPGTGGTNGACTVTGTTGTGTKAQFAGDVNGGGLRGPLTVLVPGDYTVNPTSLTAEPVTGCGLTGAVVNMQMGILVFWTQREGEYTIPPVNPAVQLSTSGTGTGATFNLRYSAPSGSIFPSLVPGGGSTYLGFGAGSNNKQGTENTYVGYQAGGKMLGSFNTAMGHNACGIGGGTGPFAGSNNTCFGTDAGRNFGGGNSQTFIGANAGYTQSNTAAQSIVLVGTSAGRYLNTTVGNTDVTCVGTQACMSAAGSGNDFRGITAIGKDTAAAITTATNSTFLGKAVGSTTFLSGTGVLLIGSGNQTVTTAAAGTSNWLNIENAYRANTVAPTVSSGFGTSPTIPAGTSSAGFTVNVGTGGTANTGVIAFATAAPTGWICTAVDQTNPGTSNTVAIPLSTTTITLNNYSRTTGLLAAWAASDVIAVSCNGF
jgi:hypothetical protein